MKKYKFRLQTVLEIKEKNLEQKLQELAQVVSVLNKEVEIEKNLIKQQSELQNKIITMNSIDTPKSLFEIQNSRGYWGALSIKIAQQKNRIKNVEEFMKAKQIEVNRALQEKKVLENLKEKEEARFYKSFLDYERRELDDIAISRYARR